MKGGKYAKSLTKIQGSAIFEKQDIRIIHLPKFIELCLETPCWIPIRMGTHMAAGNQQKQLLWSFPTKASIHSRGTHKHKSNTFFNRTVPIAKSPKTGHFFNPHDSSLGRHVNSASRKSLEIQAHSIPISRAVGFSKFRIILAKNNFPLPVKHCNYTPDFSNLSFSQ